MNGHCLLSPAVKIVKIATVFYYIHAGFMFCICHNCMYLTVLKLKSSHNATIVFVSYAYAMLSYS